MNLREFLYRAEDKENYCLPKSRTSGERYFCVNVKEMPLLHVSIHMCPDMHSHTQTQRHVCLCTANKEDVSVFLAYCI